MNKIMEYSVYQIIRNANERRILVINQYFDVEKNPEIQEDKFDIRCTDSPVGRV